jgi:hypothetical protein
LGIEVKFDDFEDFDGVKVFKYFLKNNGNGENSKCLS